MKSLLLILGLLALTALPAKAALEGAPFIPEIDSRFHDLEKDGSEGEAIAKKIAVASFDVAVDGGSSTATKDLGIDLPANSIITDVYVYVNTAFTKAGGGAGVASLAFQCAGTRDLMEYQNISALAAGNMYSRRRGTVALGSGAAIGTGAALESYNSGSVATACSVTAVVRGDSGYEAYTAGKSMLVIEYLKTE